MKNLLIALGLSASACVLYTSCIRQELPNINVDIAQMDAAFSGSGIVKTTIQENSVTMYGDMSKVNLSDLAINVRVSEGASWEFVDVKMDTTFIEYGGQKIYVAGLPGCSIDTTVTAHSGMVKDFTETRYIKVTAEATGLDERDRETRQSFSKFGGLDPETNRLFKVWAINVLPAGLPQLFTFDNWHSPAGRDYWHPYEWIGETGQQKESYVWSSTNNSIALMRGLPGVVYGASYVEGAEAKSGKALLLTSNDIRMAGTDGKPFLAGCCFIGEFDGSDSGALTCTHVGLPYNGKKPGKLAFWYKFLPADIIQTEVKGSADYAGQKDKGFIKAVLFRMNDQVPYLNGETIRDEHFKNTIAYAEFYPGEDPEDGEVVSEYTYKEVDFQYVGAYDEEEMKDWKYGMAIYFASSKEGFRFICGGGTKLYIDEMEIK